MKKIQWNQVTWYSKLIAVIVFALAFALAYKLGVLTGSAEQSTADVYNRPIATDCPNAMTQLDLDSCEFSEYQAIDTNLKTLIATIPSSVEFTSAEKDWEAYRDNQCKADADQFEGGTIAPLIQAGCLVELTQQRIAYLTNDYLIDNQ